MDNISRRTELLLLIIALFITTLLYAQVYHFDFVWDDVTLIAQNPTIQQNVSLKSIFLHRFWEVSQDDLYNPPFYRPIVTLAYAIEYHFFGLQSGLYHLVNLLFHLFNGALIWSLGRRLQISIQATTMSVFLFLLHPVQVSSVCFISCHGDILALFFSLLAINIWTAESKYRYVGLLPLFIAILCKEVAIFLPVVFILYDVVIKRASIKNHRIYLPLLCWLPYFILRHFVMQYPSEYESSVNELWKSPGSFRVFLLLGRILSPIPNPVDLKVPILSNVSYIFFHIAIICLGYIAITRTKNNPVIRFLLIWFSASILLVADYLNVGLRFSDQFLYYPLFAVTMIFATILPKAKKFSYVIAAVIIVYLGLDVLKIPTWKNSIRLWKDAITYDPTNPRYRMNYGEALNEFGERYEACETFRYTLKLLEKTFEPTIYKWTAYEFGNCILNTNPALAEDYYLNALKIEGKCILCLHSLSLAYLNQNKLNEAVTNTQHLIDVNTDRVESWELLSKIYLKMKDKEKSEDVLRHVKILQSQ